MTEVDERIRILADDIREMDQLIFAMSQCMSWEGMRPHFQKLLALTMKRKEAESARIGEIMRRELISVYSRKLTPEQIKLIEAANASL